MLRKKEILAEESQNFKIDSVRHSNAVNLVIIVRTKNQLYKD